MDKTRFFGAKVAAKLEPPARDKAGAAVYSRTIDDFYYHVDDALADGRPFIYVLDSMDSLTSDYELRKFNERKEFARRPRKGAKAPAGDYGDGKAKRNSAGMRGVVSRLRGSESVLIVISQTRDNIDDFSFETKTRSGGRALKFYATVEIWTSVVKRLKRTVRGEELQIGIVCRAAVKKNRASGKEWTVDIPLYHTYGIDDIGSMVDYLTKWKHWKANDNGIITAPELDFEGRRDTLIKRVEDGELERDLRGITAEVWAEVEEAAALQRKPRY